MVLRALALAAGFLLVAGPALPATTAAQERVHVRIASPTGQGGWLGLSLDRAVTVEAGRSPRTTLTIGGVFEGGPAARAGLRAGDRIVRVGGEPADPILFERRASRLTPGDTLTLTVEREEGWVRDVVVVAARPPASSIVFLSPETAAEVESTMARMNRVVDSLRIVVTDTGSVADRLGEMLLEGRTPDGREARVRFRLSSDAEARPGPLLPFIVGERIVAGARLTELNPDLASYFSVEEGMLVTQVIPGTPAAGAGLRPGDVLVNVAGRPVRSRADVRDGWTGAPAGAIPVLVVREGERIELRFPR